MSAQPKKLDRDAKVQIARRNLLRCAIAYHDAASGPSSLGGEGAPLTNLAIAASEYARAVRGQK